MFLLSFLHLRYCLAEHNGFKAFLCLNLYTDNQSDFENIYSAHSAINNRTGVIQLEKWNYKQDTFTLSIL